MTESTQATTYSFQAEVNQVLDLVIHSLYGHREVFLRELVSNAADALDRLRFQTITEPALLGSETALRIRIVPNKDAGTLTIEDTGTGMSRDELVTNLGTIAKSGTKAFAEALKQAGNKDVNLIGQFGVGFYSAYLVASRVDVVTRAAGSAEAWRWSSDAKGSFTVEATERAERGTSVVLHLRDDQKEFLDEWRVKDLVRRYSDFVSHPIELAVVRGADKHEEFDTINRASALWMRPRAEVTKEQHEEFYKHISHDGEAPVAWTHFSFEGNVVFTGLLYLPKLAPMFDVHPDERGVRLFVKRVFVMEKCQDFLPAWLRFVRGVLDSDDLPLNVSRETLQDSGVVRTMKKQVVKKTLDLIDELAQERPEDFTTFWENFGSVVKEGLANDWEHKDRLAKVVRYRSSATMGKSGAEAWVSLPEYVKRMPLRQEAIYYVSGESPEALADSPHVEVLRKRGYEILFMTDAVDEWATETLREFDGKPLVSAMRDDLKLKEDDEEKRVREARTEELKGLIGRMTTVLGSRVEAVRVSSRLTDSPACLVVPEGAHHAMIGRLLKKHGRGPTDDRRTLEVNPTHPLIGTLAELFTADGSSPKLDEWIELLFEQARLTEGGTPENPQKFAKKLTELLVAAAEKQVAHKIN